MRDDSVFFGELDNKEGCGAVPQRLPNWIDREELKEEALEPIEVNRKRC